MFKKMFRYNYFENARYHWAKLMQAPSHACRKRQAEFWHALNGGMVHRSNQGQPWHWSKQVKFRVDNYDAFE